MIPTLQTFTRALLTPDLSLKTLTDARTETENGGYPRLMRTTRFAEARIEWQGRHWLLSMPLTPVAMLHIERTASALRRLNSDFLAEYRVLPGELIWQDAAGDTQACDLVLQHLPEGTPFAEALLTVEPSALLAALDALEAEFRRLGFAHHNLKAENLRWCGGRLIPLRYHDARLGEVGRPDAEAFDALRRTVGASTGPQGVSDMAAPYNPLRRLSGHLWTSHVFEGLICVEDEGGFGYVDTDNNPVIPAGFLWADDFHEGRAEVETPTGMGLIDRQGCYVIPPEYEIVDYKPAESIAYVRQRGRWAIFDYLGRRLTEFRERIEEAGSEIC